MKLEQVNNSLLLFVENPSLHISEYYKYCVEILKKELDTLKTPVNVNFNLPSFNFENDLKTINIGLQYEHTLVKKNGRGLNYVFESKTKTEEGENYLIRIDQYPSLVEKDIIIDYSLSNLTHISTNPNLEVYLNKCRYVPLLTYGLNLKSEGRTDIISNFSAWNERRSNFINKVKKNVNNFQNITDCFEKQNILNQFSKTKILVNVHQTDEHHTLEELRILPALTQGVIVISEKIPLIDTIPYNKHIIWSDYNNLENTILEVINNYNYYHGQIFNKEFVETINTLKKETKIIL